MSSEQINRLMRDGKAYFFNETYNEAIRCFNDVLKLADSVKTESDSTLAEIFMYLGRSNHAEGNYLKGREQLEQALKLYHVNDVLMIANTNLWLGDSYQRQGQYHEAKKQYEESLTHYRFAYPDNTPHEEISRCLFSLGAIYWRLRKENSNTWFDKAHNYFSASLEMLYQLSNSKDGENNEIEENLLWIGKVYFSNERYFVAEKYFVDALTMNMNNKSILNTAAELHWLGNAYAGQEKYVKALSSYEEALETWILVYGPNHPDIGDTLIQMGKVYESTNDYKKAKDYYEKAMLMYSPTHPSYKALKEHLKLINLLLPTIIDLVKKILPERKTVIMV
jgi:tetratricopeptide (TPR) repeat protein